MDFFVCGVDEATGPYSSLQSAIENAETRALETMRDWRNPKRQELCKAGFQLSIETDTAPADWNGYFPIGVSLECRGAHGRWNGIAREDVHADVGGTSRAELDRATSALFRWHIDNVRGYVVQVLGEVADGSIVDSEGLDEYLRETIDGCSEVIYTFKAKCVLLASDNADAYEEETGEDNGGEEQRAFYAMCADVRDMLERFDCVYWEKELSADVRLALTDWDMDDDDTYPASLPDADTLRKSIVEGAARCMYALSWASAVETARGIEGLQAPNLSGCEIMDECGETSVAAGEEATRFIARLESVNGQIDIGAYFRRRVLRGAMKHAGRRAGSDPEEIAKDFGHYLCMEAIGHGVSWTDSGDAEHGLLVGSLEYCETHRFPVDESRFMQLKDEEGREYDILRVDGCGYADVEGFA